jgi:hypothetical protein
MREALEAQPILRSLRKDCALCDYITFAEFVDTSALEPGRDAIEAKNRS